MSKSVRFFFFLFYLFFCVFLYVLQKKQLIQERSLREGITISIKKKI